jgi:hypothetical protein
MAPRFLLLAIAVTTPTAAQELLPWQHWVYTPDVADLRALPELPPAGFASSGGPEGTLTVEEEADAPFEGPAVRFDVKIDHHNEGPYPKGWPSFEIRPEPHLDLSGYDALRYFIRYDGGIDYGPVFRFILWTGGAGRINEPISGMRKGEWVEVTRRLTDVPALDDVDRVHFFLDEADYGDGDEVTFRVGGFALCRLERHASTLGEGEAALGLYVGERADTSEAVVLLDEGTAELPLLSVVEAGAGTELRADDTLRVRFHEVFSGMETFVERPLGRDVAAGEVSRQAGTVPIGDLPGGYYLVTADALRDGESVLGGRVGCDDLYIRRPDETTTFTVLSVRAGMALWCRDLLYGDIMGWTGIHLPHVYDPLNAATYGDFLRLFGQTTGKHTEGNEAGDAGIVLAAEAFRKSGDAVRQRFCEWLAEDSFRHMIDAMQAPSGATIMYTNELGDHGIVDTGRSESFGTYDSNQIGEWMRAITYGILYFRTVPGREAYARELSAACRKAGDFLVAHSVQDSDGIPGVMRHLRLIEREDGTVEQVTYQQEGRQCDVYLGRALAGLSYYAYAAELLGEEVPDEWFSVMDNTTAWCDRKMRPDGWFDWQCEDIVEGGCHTFLGSIYVAEGLFGCYLASKVAGREAEADESARVALRGYHYLTDSCYVHGVKYEYPLEFWVGPYVYWLFTEWQDTVGPDERLQDWLTVLDDKWSVERGWHDFLDRAPEGGCGRTEANGMLALAILGYLGIKQMDEVGQPLHWPTEAP